MRIWINPATNEELAARLRNQLSNHEVVESISDADVIYGRTPPDKLTALDRVKWIHVDAAGYEKFDTPENRKWIAEKGIPVSNSSSVYSEPCAQHALAMMLAASRELMASWVNQGHSQEWPMLPIRARSTLLLESKVLLLGYGAIARRLVELLRPFRPMIAAFRRQSGASEAGISFIQPDELPAYFGWADHIVNLLPSNPATQHFVNADRLKHCSASSSYYSIGRGVTTEQDDLVRALREGRPRLAYLDVTDPEPLPPNHELWRLSNCFITPHTAGGHTTESDRLVEHFLRNLRAFEAGEALSDRIFN